MHTKSVLIGSFIWLLSALAGSAANPINCQPVWCPNNYSRKPMPWINCPRSDTHCEDYCRKPMPFINCLHSDSSCNDYQKKPYPRFCWPPNPAAYICGPDCRTR